MVVAFTLGRLVLCAVDGSSPVVVRPGQARSKREMCRNTVVKRNIAASGNNECVNVTGALDDDYNSGVIARSR